MCCCGGTIGLISRTSLMVYATCISGQQRAMRILRRLGPPGVENSVLIGTEPLTFRATPQLFSGLDEKDRPPSTGLELLRHTFKS